MSPLERRDRRRARKVAEDVMDICAAESLTLKTQRMLVEAISVALKREREEAFDKGYEAAGGLVLEIPKPRRKAKA